MQRSYIKVLFLSGLVVLTLSAVLNFVVDPYGLFRWIELEGFNTLKPKSGPNGQLVKPATQLRVKSDGNPQARLNSTNVEILRGPTALLQVETVDVTWAALQEHKNAVVC